MISRRHQTDDSFPWLDFEDHFDFPDAHIGAADAPLAQGGNLSPGMLLSAYSQGIFPWFSEGEPILWWSPDPRFVIYTDKVHVSTSMRKILRQKRFRISFDTCFKRVMQQCAAAYRPGQGGTWITEEMIDGYTRLHERGFAHSVEVWQSEQLVGGLYGVSTGGIFCGESMFSQVSNSSKAGFLTLARHLQEAGVPLVDSQVHTNYLESLGAEHIARAEYLGILNSRSAITDLLGSWSDRFKDINDW